MSRSVVDDVFARVEPVNVATGMWTGTGPDRFLHLRVPDGEAPDGACQALKIVHGQPGGGIQLTPARYRMTNELVKFLAHSSAGVFSYEIVTNGDDVYASLAPEVHWHDVNAESTGSDDDHADHTVYRSG